MPKARFHDRIGLACDKYPPGNAVGRIGPPRKRRTERNRQRRKEQIGRSPRIEALAGKRSTDCDQLNLQVRRYSDARGGVTQKQTRRRMPHDTDLLHRPRQPVKHVVQGRSKVFAALVQAIPGLPRKNQRRSVFELAKLCLRSIPFPAVAQKPRHKQVHHFFARLHRWTKTERQNRTTGTRFGHRHCAARFKPGKPPQQQDRNPAHHYQGDHFRIRCFRRERPRPNRSCNSQTPF